MMKLWRYKILIDLYDSRFDQVETLVEDDCTRTEIVDSPGRIWDEYDSCRASITLFTIVSQRSEPVTRKQLNQLIELGDVVETKRYYTNSDDLGAIIYEISPSGIAALEALPNFERRIQKVRA
jgi:hypothetical protein